MANVAADSTLALKVVMTDSKGNVVGAPPAGTTVTWSDDNTAILGVAATGDTTTAVATPVGPVGAANVVAVVTVPSVNPITTPAFPVTVVAGTPVSAVIEAA